ncbi:MAG: hypothetical protein J6Z23_07855, partial [Lachnospiraceae bacterium]|nr:hypothetical protein [Lachnospiraceae bacterium]
VLCSAVFLHEPLGLPGWIGAALVLTAALVSETAFPGPSQDAAGTAPGTPAGTAENTPGTPEDTPADTAENAPSTPEDAAGNPPDQVETNPCTRNY